ncbi:SDR family NAD(P)-dependent oxidoreductase [Mesorhizobium sp.]|uniref:SDR family oxidoreductase n=1 Tax=Mesorhizobium sp. TaxID=1871066 RepID=UPI0025C0BDFE|nr:SDR family NAD(P)-dependent oxidoreductase [Mesorhizobium sp.]
MAKSDSDKVLLITGAASGIGAATAKLAVEMGHRVVVADINEAGAASVAASLGPAAIGLKLDICSPEQWEFALDETYKRFQRLDVLVNNAAVVHTGSTREVPLALHRQTMEVNVIGPLIGMRAVLPRFRAAKSGHIATVCSMTAFLPFPGIASYAASKHALRALHLAVAMEERDSSIAFTIVHPSSTETPMLEEEARTGVALAFAVPSWRPEDVAKIIMDAIKRKKVEVCIPSKRGRVVKAIGANPRRLLETVERNQKIGMENLAIRRQSVGQAQADTKQSATSAGDELNSGR